MYQDEKAPPTIKRRIQLLVAGYRIREQNLSDADNYISLEHPAHWQKPKEKSLDLFDDGSVMGGPRVDNTCLLIKPGDAAEFQLLVAETPKPTWWERNSGPFYQVLVLVIIGMMVAGTKLIDFV